MIKEDPHNSNHQIHEVEALRNHMHDILSSTSFQDLETQTPLEFHDIQSKQRADSSNLPDRSQAQLGTQDLPRALAKALAEQVALLNPKVASNVELND